MKNFGLSFLAICAFTIFGNVMSLSLDPVASGELEQFIKDDVVISMRHIRPRRKVHISVEALFMIDFPSMRNKLSFFLDRTNHEITVDIHSNSEVIAKSFKIESINTTATIRSLAIHFHNDLLTIWIDCKDSVEHNIGMSLSKIYSQMDNMPIVKLFRERKYPLYFDKTVDDAHTRAHCQKIMNRNRGNKKMLKHKNSDKEKTKKRDVRDWYNPDPSDRYHHRREPGLTLTTPQTHLDDNLNDVQRRGDIPVIHGDCEDALAKSLAELMELVKLLREDIAHQRKEILYLRSLIENCYGCKEPRPDDLTSSTGPNCRNANPCYPGVECHDSMSGMRCGRCPPGFVGDGKICKIGLSCLDRPCFTGVQCIDTMNGAQCGPCPTGYEGDGKTCTIRNPCIDSPCPAGNYFGPTHSSISNYQHYQRKYTRKYSVTSNYDNL